MFVKNMPRNLVQDWRTLNNRNDCWNPQSRRKEIYEKELPPQIQNNNAGFQKAQ